MKEDSTILKAIIHSLEYRYGILQKRKEGILCFWDEDRDNDKLHDIESQITLVCSMLNALTD